MLTGNSMIAGEAVCKNRGEEHHIRDEKVLDDDGIECVDALCYMV